MTLTLVIMDKKSNQSIWDDLKVIRYYGPVQYKNNGQYTEGQLDKLAGNFDGSVQYKNNGQYKSIIVEATRWKASQAIIKGLKDELYEALYGKRLKERKQYFEDIQNQRKEIRQKIIEQQQKIHEDYGKLDDIIAQDKYGKKVDGALIIWYKDTKYRTEKQTVRSSVIADPLSPTDPYHSVTNTIQTDKMYVIDLAPQITINSSKNIVLTKVQGRDYTRKELVSGGDLCFTVSGELNSNQDGVYPTFDVQKFINIMQHNGIISVNNILFDQFNVSRIIIQSFKLDPPKYQNIQPYSFTCVAVEPDEQVAIDDTINIIDYKLNTSGANGVVDIAARKWWTQITENALTHPAASATNWATESWSAGLSDMIPNI